MIGRADFTTTVFTANTSSTALYTPATVTSPGTTSTTGYVYDATSGKPLLVVAPDAATSRASTTACPAPASSSTWTTAGCRGLAFSYDPTSGNVAAINFVYVDNAGTFHSVAVADYTYDNLGKLSAEWDPRLSTPLKNTYTYDETSTDADYGRITQISPAQATGSGALAPWRLTYDDTSSDANYGKVVKVTRTHSAAYGAGTATTTVGYSVPLTITSGGPINMDVASVAAWGQNDVPTSAVAVWNPAHVPASHPTATDYEYATVHYYDADGREVNTATYVSGAWAVSTSEYDAYGNPTRELTAANRAAALASASPLAVSQQLDTRYLYACDNFGTVAACTSSSQKYQVLTDTYGPAHTADVNGVVETVRDHTTNAYDVGAPNADKDANGDPYMLQTSVTTSASIGSSVPGSSTADARTTQYLYTVGSDATGWTLGAPLQTVTDPSSLKLTSTTAYNENASLYNGDNLIVDRDQPSDPSGGTAGDIHSVYYTAGANSQQAACGNKPAWANLICQTYPAAQPSDTNTIPTVIYTYDDYLSVLSEVKQFGPGSTETETYTYDSADRKSGESIAVSGTNMGVAPAPTATVFSPNSGLPTDTETLTSAGGVATDINTAYDDFGQQISYKDANNESTSYTYNLNGQAVTRTTPFGTDTITYSPGGQPAAQSDSLVGTFTATYNPDGLLQTQTFPDGTTASYRIDPTGVPTLLTYNNTKWAGPIADSVTLNAHGDWSAESVLSDKKSSAYDNADRLTSVQDSNEGSCTTRTYTYDADSNRTGLTAYGPGAGGSCQTSTVQTSESYSYDAADRLLSNTQAGITSAYAYDAQGDTTTTPSNDAGGSGTLSATYYATGMLATQTQNGVTDSFTLDGNLDRYASKLDSSTGYTTIDDYSDGSSMPAWSTTNGTRTVNVTGLDGKLVAQVSQAGSVTLDLTDLHGDILATVDPGADTAPSATYTYTEFGAAESGSGSPGEYGYLGSDLIAGSGLGGTLLTGARGYNVNIGRFASVDPVFQGSANAYDYGSQNPLTHVDTSGDAWCNWFGCLTRSGNGLYWGMNWKQAVEFADDFFAVEGLAVGWACARLGLQAGFICSVIVAGFFYIVHEHLGNMSQAYSARWWKFTYGITWYWFVPVPWIHYWGYHTYY